MSDLPAARSVRRRAAWGLSAALCLGMVPIATLGQRVSAPADEVGAQLEALLASVPPGTQVGLVVVDVATEQCWYAHLPQTPLKPASVLKLFVTAAALDRFGPAFGFTTRAYTCGDELWVLGAGDPGLGDERLAGRHGRSLLDPFDTWARTLRARGVESVSTIVLDDGVFDRQTRHPDWPADQASRWYQAPVGGLNFNDNCVDARVEVQAGVARLVLRPALPASFYVNALTVGKKHEPVVRRATDSDVFEFRGVVNRDCELAPASARRPTVFFGYALKQTLEAQGIRVRGNVVRRTITPAARRRATLLAEHTTPLRDVLWRCNTFSQNLFAECLLKSLAAYEPDGRRGGRPGSWATGTQIMSRTLADMGLDLTGAVLRDGCGLSHGNRVTAAQVTRLLVRMRHHRHAAAFVESLAVPGEDGSMRQRYADPVLCERLRGKTGSISGVRALAGYVTRPDGTVLAFALLCNGQSDQQLPAQVALILAGETAG